ncbi:MAG TPA: hypothetical protein VKD90_23130 [Gemmataceae bacterium]|nr:hypothetical protein [Gemmataceae bacterium]
MPPFEQILALLPRCDPGQRRELFQLLRADVPLHPLEAEWHTRAEVFLEAIRLSSDLTRRMLRGILAEAAFRVEIVNRLPGWQAGPLTGSPAYDFLLSDQGGDVRVQVKLQRSKGGKPLDAHEGRRSLPAGMYLVETQKTRKGSRNKQETRPYRFGEFDLLAAAMYPATQQWDKFMYTVARWLIPDPTDRTLIFKYQPVSHQPDADWTDSFETAVRWFRSGKRKTICAGNYPEPKPARHASKKPRNA